MFSLYPTRCWKMFWRTSFSHSFFHIIFHSRFCYYGRHLMIGKYGYWVMCGTSWCSLCRKTRVCPLPVSVFYYWANFLLLLLVSYKRVTNNYDYLALSLCIHNLLVLSCLVLSYLVLSCLAFSPLRFFDLTSSNVHLDSSNEQTGVPRWFSSSSHGDFYVLLDMGCHSRIS